MKLVSLAAAGALTAALPLNDLGVFQATEETPVFLSVEYCDWNVSTSEGDSQLFSGQTRCYCVTHSGTDYGCSVPGPVIQFTAGTTGVVDFTNNLVGWDSDDIEQAGIEENVYRGMDITNLHTHGLHVSPDEDDVLISIEPSGGHRRYNYTMPADHYFGTHWYHAHHHGSTSLQVTGGLLGGLEVIGPDMSTLDDYDPTWLILHYFYAVSESDCNNCQGGDFEDYQTENDDEFVAEATCFMHCSYAAGERSNSEFTYDISTSNSDTEYFLVNGQYTPTVSIERNSFTWLRFVNGMGMYYAQLSFPEECEAWLAGNDGVFFESMRDLSSDTYNRETVMNPGSRADVFIKCDTTGTYPVKYDSSQNGGSDSRPPDGIVAFYISVSSDEGSNADLPSIPARPSYLGDLRDGSDLMENGLTEFQPYCPCAYYTDDEFGGLCGIEFDFEDDLGTVNEVAFDHDSPLFLVRSDTIYEYILDNEEHPYHQHINHFQVQGDVSDGFVAQNGDWRDTLGSPDGGDEHSVRMRFVDFTGKVVMHCHFLPHEDKGMMAYYVIIDKDDPDNETYPLLNTCDLLGSGSPRLFAHSLQWLFFGLFSFYLFLFV